jgi:hypothetical protein
MNDAKIIPGATGIVEKLRQAFLQANLINPAFILFDGDLVRAGTVSQFEYFKILCRNLQVPIFALAGNHELSSGISNYAEEIASFYYALEYGEAFFIMACTWANGSLDPTQLEWIEDQLAGHQDSPLKVITMHFPVWHVGTWDYYIPEAEEFTEICQKYGVDLVLYAKEHTDDARTVNGTIYLMTTAVAAEVWPGKENGYRVINIRGLNVVDYSYDGENLSQPVAGIQVERVPEDVHVLDKGLRMRITNKLSSPLEDLTIKAALEPLIDDKYLIFNATPVSTFNSSSGCLIIGECSVPVDSSVEVTIHPSNPSAPQIVDVSYPMEVEESNGFSVEATVENELSGVESVELYYTIDELEWKKIYIGYSETNTYSASIPAQPPGTSFVKFYVIAKDFSGLEVSSDIKTVTFISEEMPIGFELPLWVLILLVLIAVVAGIFIIRLRKKGD